jgi:hypothetical protein
MDLFEKTAFLLLKDEKKFIKISAFLLLMIGFDYSKKKNPLRI